MSLTRPFTDIREQLNRMFYDMTEDFGFPMALRSERPFREGTVRSWFPTIELRDADSEILLRAEVPGLKPEDINVEVNENYVIISGETREEKKEEKENLYHSEFRYGNFYRRVALPTSVKSEGSKADYKNGVLELRFPKKVTTPTKRITVNAK